MNNIKLYNVNINNYHAQKSVDFYHGFLGFHLLGVRMNQLTKSHELDLGVSYKDSYLTVNTFPNDTEFLNINDSLITEIAFEASINSISYWEDRFNSFKVAYTKNNNKISFKDPAGINLSIVFDTNNKDYSLTNIKGISLNVLNIVNTNKFYEDLFKVVSKDKDIYLNNQVLSLDEKSFPLNFQNQLINSFNINLDKDSFNSLKNKLISNNIPLLDQVSNDNYETFSLIDPSNIIITISTNYLLDKKIDNNLLIENNLYPVFTKEVSSLVNYPYQNYDEYLSWDNHQKLLKQINYLSKKSKKEGLTEEEKELQQKLRKQYVKNITSSLRSNMDSIKIEDDKGDFVSLTKKKVD